MSTTVALPRVHMAGSDAHYDAHIEVGQHGFALFLAASVRFRLRPWLRRPRFSKIKEGISRLLKPQL